MLTLSEAPGHPQLRARHTFIEYDDHVQPTPAPRFSRTPSAIQSPPPAAPHDIEQILADWRSRS